MFVKRLILIGLSLAIAVIMGCDAKNGEIANEITLPTDVVLTLSCEDAGVHPEKCVLDDADNPFSAANVNMENVWDLNDDCPTAKSKFYLWATILAKIPMGEHQYFTARSLHELYTEGESENAREQAKKAYRSVLDNFFDSTTWYEAWWIGEDLVYAVALKDLVGEGMYDPSDMNLAPLYDDPVLALVDLSEWGYIYDEDTGVVSKWE